MTKNDRFTTLISPQELYLHLENPNFIIIDTRFDLSKPAWGAEEYAKAHIPGAQYAHLDRDLSGAVTPKTGRHPLPEPEDFIRTASAWGIQSTSQVVVYDTSGGSFACRLWWLLRYYGHTAVAVLDGSLNRWKAENYPNQVGVESRGPAHFRGAPQPGWVVETAEIPRISTDPAYCLLDARTDVRYRGEQEPIDPIAGHIPGAVNYFHGLNLTSEGTFRSKEDLRAVFEKILGPIAPDHMVVYCGSGVTSIHHLLAMEYAGLPGAKLYAGSWSEWIRDSAHPISTTRT